MSQSTESDVRTVMVEENHTDLEPAIVNESLLDVSLELPDNETVVSAIHEVPKLDVTVGRSRVTPRYLAGSVSSCHDNCKHGKRREDEVKPWKLGRKKCVEVRKEDKSTLEKRETLVKKAVAVRRVDKSVLEKTENSDINEKKSGIDRKKHVSAAYIQRITESEESMTVVTGKKNILKKGTAMVVKRAENLSEEKSSKTEKNIKKAEDLPKETVKKVSKFSPKIANGLGLGSSKNPKTVLNRKPGPSLSAENVPEKTVYVVESSVKKERREDAPNEIRQVPSASSSRKKIDGSGKSDGDARKRLPLLPQRSEARPIRVLSKSKSINRSSGLYKHKQNNSVNGLENSKAENKSTVKRVAVKVTATIQKLGFTRSKPTSLPWEDSILRRLKFRKRILHENSKNGQGTGQRKSFKNGEDGDGKSDGGETRREKVVLRHRKVEGKKKTQTLFNNVIEETANKLAETKTSKVKALVGAFETVISLQDKSPSPGISRRSSSAAKG